MQNELQSFHALASGTVLNGVYTVEAELGQGGYGIVYRARHRDLGAVAIKEYLPTQVAVREGRSVHPRSTDFRDFFEEGMERFLEEAKQLIKFRAHPSIVSCRDFFRANGTAYLVMNFEEGLPLSKLLEVREAEGRPFGEADLLAVIMPLLDGLAQVHEAGVLHRDIKPSNILIRREDEQPVLIDFGAAKREFAKHSKSLAPYTPGYAAIEQVSEGRLGTWTDMYGIGAVMWRMVAGGNRPYEPPQPVRVERRVHAKFRGDPDPLPSARELGRERFSARVLGAIDQCLELRETDRVRGCRELLGLFDSEEGGGGGRRTFTASDGSVLEGPYVDGKKQGDWVIRFANGNVWEGSYRDDKMHGRWVLRFADGKAGEGLYVDGKRHGHWVERSVNGTVWKGSYVNDEKHGRWVIRRADGSTLDRHFVNGKEVSSVWRRTGRSGLELQPMQAQPGKRSTEASSQPKRLEWPKWVYPSLLAFSFVPILLMVLMAESFGSSSFSRFISFLFFSTMGTLMIGCFSPASKLRRILGVISLIGITVLFIMTLRFGMASEVLSFPVLTLIGIFGGLAIRTIVAKGDVFWG